MNRIPWKTAAMLTGRKMRTHTNNLKTCISELMSLPSHQREAAHIIVPGCITFEHHRAVRTLSRDTITMLIQDLSRGNEANQCR